MYSFVKRLEGFSGSAIRAIFALLSDPDMISFAGGNPAPSSFDGEALSRIAAKIIAEQSDTVLQYGDTHGWSPMIDTVISQMAKRGISAAPENVLITTGSTQGIGLAIKAFVEPGDTVLVESPSFIGTLQALRFYGANLVGFTMDDLEQKLAAHRPKLLYVIPNFQNPSGGTMGAADRKTLYELCVKYNTVILEDDPYCDLRYSGEALPPIKTLDRAEMVIHFFSASKIVSPGIRVGAAVANPEIIDKLKLCKQGEDLHTPNLTQAIASAYIDSPEFAPHMKAVCAMYARQRDAMAKGLSERLPDFSFTLPDGGMFLWCTLPEYVDTQELFSRAVANKVAFVPGCTFFADRTVKNTLRMNFSMCGEEKIAAGIERLAEVYGGKR